MSKRKKYTAYVMCEQCDGDHNCHPLGEMRIWRGEPICENHYDEDPAVWSDPPYREFIGVDWRDLPPVTMEDLEA